MSISRVEVLVASLFVMVAASACPAGEYWDSSSATANLRSGLGAPSARGEHALVLVGASVFTCFGHTGQLPHLNDGGVYDPPSDSWLLRPMLQAGAGAPSPRYAPCVATDGRFVFVFGGGSTPLSNILNSGGVYDTQTDTWLALPRLNAGIGAPAPRYDGFAVHVDGLFYVFGGSRRHPANSYQVPVFDGGCYDIATDTWLPRATLNSPVAAPEFNEGAVWTGEQILARGGFGGSIAVYPGSSGFVCSAGGAYDVVSDGWLPRPTLRSGIHAADRWHRSPVWTGEYYIEYGGRSEIASPNPPWVFWHNDGLCYHSLNDSLLVNPNLNQGIAAPEAREYFQSAWTGAHMWVWGGSLTTQGGSQASPKDGGLYDPVSDQWVNAPNLNGALGVVHGQLGGRAVFDGSRIYLWGGGYKPTSASSLIHNTGAVYVPPRVAPTIRSGVPTGVTQTTWPMGGVPPGGEQVEVGQFWRHRVTVYGCPRSTVTVTGMPGWMTQKYLDTGCFLEGTPGPGDNHKLHVISIVAANGIGTDAIQSFTVKVGNPLPPSQFFTLPVTTATAGELYQYTPLAVGTPTPIVVMTVGPSWLTWVGNKLQGKPPYAASGTSVQIRLEAVAQSQSTGAQDFLIHVDYSPYDIDRDKSVDVVDVQTTVNLILSLATPTYPTQGDTNASGVVDVVDVQAIVNKILMP